MPIYTLPDLPYDYAALEPHISGKIMQLHHDKHHAAYVAGANTALEQLADARDKGDLTWVNQLEKNLAFNLGGHINHTIFWENMTPEGQGEPADALADQITADFGSFDKFKKHFAAVAAGVQGSGWAILAWDSIGERLVIVQLYDQQGNLPISLTPILMLDCWEHAYYLDYLNVRADYVTAWWNIVNWDDAANRLARAKAQTKGLLIP
jgi:Fe-Mn family superoxide dismutase